jgi:hypothetical protein
VLMIKENWKIKVLSSHFSSRLRKNVNI